jgi:membrane protein required for colicin V production
MDIFATYGFDIGVACTLFLGALIGLAVGFVRGGLFVISWIGAGIVTLAGFSTVRPYARAHIDNPYLADFAGGAILFILTLIVFFLVSSVIGSWVRNSRLNALDRSLGMVAGLLTAALALAAAYMGMEQIWKPEDQPKWIKEARSAPLVRTSAYMLNDALPADFKVLSRQASERVTQESRDLLDRKKAFDKLMQPIAKAPAGSDRDGYDDKERRSLERLIDGKQ